MNKYEKYDNYYDDSQEELRIENMLTAGEKILWKGKPDKTAFFINSIFGIFTLFAIIWLGIDVFFIYTMLANVEDKAMLVFTIPFFALHLFPVWMWLGQIVTAGKRWKNTEYAATDKRILLKTGFWRIDFKSVYYKDIKNVSLRKGLFDSMFGVADIYFDLSYNYLYLHSNENSNRIVMFDLKDSYEIYTKLQKTIFDIQTDMEIPNDYIPNENSGYKI